VSAADAPLFAEAIEGVRVWEAIESEDGEPLLRAWVQDSAWPCDGPMRASCVGAWRRLPTEHVPPHGPCTCGIYALHPWRGSGELLGNLARCDAGVVGAVRAWGRVELHHSGFRSEWARPSRLFFTGELGEADLRTLKRVARAYDLELYRADTQPRLAAQLAKVNGVRRSVVGNLLKDVSDLVLEATANRRGSGFRLADGNPRAHGAVSFRVEVTDRDALQQDCFSLAREVRLVRERGGAEGQPSRIGVWDADRRHRIGLVPLTASRRVTWWLRRHRIRWPLVAWQWRAPAGQRVGLTILLAPTENICLSFGRRRIHLERGEHLF
jgi:hypothetical protein